MTKQRAIVYSVIAFFAVIALTGGGGLAIAVLNPGVNPDKLGQGLGTLAGILLVRCPD